MGFTRSCDVQGAIVGAWCMVLLLSSLVKAHQYDDTFDPISRRALTAGTQGKGGGHPVDPGHGGGFKVIDISKCPGAKGDGHCDVTPVIETLSVFK